MSPLLLIFFTVFIDMVGFGIVIPVLPLYAEHFHATPVEIGWLTGIYSGFQIVFMPLLGRLSDRIGRRPVLVVSLLGTALGFFIMGWAVSLPLLFLARIIDGATGGNISTAQAYVADVSTPENRSRAMGVIGAAFGLGFTFGPMIGGLLSRVSYGAPFYFAGGLASVNALLLYFILPESLSPKIRARSKERKKLREVFQHGDTRMFATLVATYFFNIAGFAMMTTLFALFTEKHFGFDAHATGLVFGLIGITSFVIQGGLIGRLVKQFGETALARAGLFFLTVSLALLALVRTVPALLGVSVALAASVACITPTLRGLASQMIDPGWQGRALGLMESAGSLGRLIGPLCAGWLLMFDLNRPLTQYARTPFFTSAGITLLAFFLALTLRKPASDKMQPALPVEADV